MLCGVAGSGKTTYARRLERQGYVRLSIDEEIWARFGRYGLDFDAAAYGQLSVAADFEVRHKLQILLAERRDVVLDLSFWQRSTRDDYKKLIEGVGGRWKLIHLALDPVVLRRRLAERAQRFDANAAFPITDELLTRYLAGFEVPRGEGEETVLG